MISIRLFSLSAYVVDVRAASFGACKCGNAKVDHSPEALSEGAAERMDAAMTDKWKVGVKLKVGTCLRLLVLSDNAQRTRNARHGVC